MLTKTFVAAVILACGWGFGQAIADDGVEAETQTVEELRKAVAELTARIEVLEKQLSKVPSDGVAPAFGRAVERFKQLPKDTTAQPVQLRRRVWATGVNAGMMIDAFEHSIRWQEAVPMDRANGRLPNDVFDIEGPTILRKSPRR